MVEYFESEDGPMFSIQQRTALQHLGLLLPGDSVIYV